MSQFIRRESKVQGQGGPISSSVPPADLVERFPALWEYLSLDRWEDGKARALSSLTVFWGDGRLKCCLNDKANNRCLFASGESLAALLTALEAALASDTADWRASSPPRPKRPS